MNKNIYHRRSIKKLVSCNLVSLPLLMTVKNVPDLHTLLQNLYKRKLGIKLFNGMEKCAKMIRNFHKPVMHKRTPPNDIQPPLLVFFKNLYM